MSRSSEEKRLFTEEVIQSVLSLDVSKVLSRRMEVKRKGYQYTALCPFHSDKHFGNFMISPHKGIYKCFACGEGGNAIKFVAETERLNFIQAAYKIALEEGLISQEDYDENLTGRKYSKKEIKSIELESVKLRPEIQIADERKRNQVYTTLLELIDEEFENGLKNEDLEYLLKERDLSLEIIKKRQYKSLDFSQYMRHKITAKLLERLNEDSLIGIPGFYQEKSKGDWIWSFPGTKGLLIPIRNSKNQIVALQVRKREKVENSSRYTWISSAFASYNEDLFRNGSSPGSPVDVIYPDKAYHSAMFITEGRFKSESIIRNFNAPSISVQGVGSWKMIEEEIQTVLNWIDDANTKYLRKQIVIAYDSDMQFNYAVYMQLKNLITHINDHFNEISIKIALWEYAEDQKGIDDYIKKLDKGNVKNGFIFIEAEEWIKIYDEQIEKFIKNNNLSNEWNIDPLAFRHQMKKIFITLKEQA